MTGARRRSATAPQPTRRQRPASAGRTSMSPKDYPQSRPVPEQRGTMSRPACPVRHTPQTTCRLRPSSTAIEPYSVALEITHAHRLRKKLDEAGAEAAFHSVRGVGWRLVT